MMMSLTSESTIFPNAAPMMTPTAKSTTLPFSANSRNSVMNDIASSIVLKVPAAARPALHSFLHRRLARFAGTDAHRLLDIGDENLAVDDLAGPSRLDDRLDRALDPRIRD